MRKTPSPFLWVMDELDCNLLAAWERVWGKCVGDAGEARKRWLRTRGVGMGKPVRAWCLTLRASDTRIGGLGGYIEDQRACDERRGHGVVFRGGDLRRLCAPVKIDWPGVKLRDAAGMLGRTVDAVRHWMPVRPGRERGGGESVSGALGGVERGGEAVVCAV